MGPSKYLVLRIPSRFYLTKPYILTESISLLPGSRYEPQNFETGQSLDCTFFYVEKNPPLEQIGPPTWPLITSYKNLRNFVIFWSFLSSEQKSIRAFETGDGPILLDSPPHEKYSIWNNNPRLLDPKRFPIRSIGKHCLALDIAFENFQNADSSLLDLATLLIHNTNRYIQDGRRVIYKNYLLQASLIWFVIDALLPSETCGGQIICPKFGKESHLMHSRTTFRSRAEEALYGFQHANKYAEILDKLRRIRGKFVHKGTYQEYPNTIFPDPDPITGFRQREVTLEDSTKNIGIEGLNTENLIYMSRDIAYWMVFNKIFIDLEIWPTIEQIKLDCTG